MEPSTPGPYKYCITINLFKKTFIIWHYPDGTRTFIFFYLKQKQHVLLRRSRWLESFIRTHTFKRLRCRLQSASPHMQTDTVKKTAVFCVIDVTSLSSINFPSKPQGLSIYLLVRFFACSLFELWHPLKPHSFCFFFCYHLYFYRRHFPGTWDSTVCII